MKALALIVVSQVAFGAAFSVPRPYATIQEACDAAASGDRILVAAGEYVLTEPIDFNRLHRPGDPAGPPLKNLALISYDGSARTVLRWSGESGNPGARGALVFAQGEDGSSYVEGFTIDGGHGASPGGNGSPSYVSGIVCSHSSPMFRDVRIVACGEPAVVLEASSSLLSECTIANNRCSAVAVREESSASLEYCTLDANEGCGEGGGLDVDSSNVTLVDCTITRNKAVGEEGGGGIVCTGGELTLERCTLMGNLARSGGALCLWEAEAVLTNCVFVGNHSLQGGGAVRIGHAAKLGMTNCTVANNSALFEGTMACDDGDRNAGAFTNCIFWANEPGGTCGETLYCACGQLPFSSTNEDPRFVEEGSFDFTRPFPDYIVDAGQYSLRHDSPCIDAGTNQGAPKVDIDAVARPCGARVDQGAFEFCSRRFRRGDANGDGLIDIADPIYLLYWLWSDPWDPQWCFEAWDANDDGMINLADPIRILSLLFARGAPLPPPFPECGWDETRDKLTCRESRACQ